MAYVDAEPATFNFEADKIDTEMNYPGNPYNVEFSFSEFSGITSI